jgi:hypothetical protein
MDIFNKALDSMLQEFPELSNMMRQVDDVLIFAETTRGLVSKMEDFMKCCQRFYITLAPKKVCFTVRGEGLLFSKFWISAEGCSKDPNKMASIESFPPI